MRLEEIVDAGDPRVADYHTVSDRQLLLDRGLFIAEGRMIVRRILAEGRCRLRSVLVSPQGLRALESSLAAVEPSVPVYVCPASAFLHITGFNIHRGCLAIVERPPDPPFDRLLADCDRIVVLEGVANADNGAGVFRNAAAFGAGAVLLSPTCCDPLYRKAVRTSMGASLTVPFVRLGDWPSPLHSLRAAGFMLVALTPNEVATPIDEFGPLPPSRKLALLIGNEGSGLSEVAEAITDVRVRIPMRHGVDSLNLAVASGIALYKLRPTRC
jgi:tRNA G18 (ribose-2'-O)-methylase SpoU